MKRFKLDDLLRSKWVVIGCLYCVATIINIDKAYHIDDTFHLEAANWIKDHPLDPMSGFINWDENKEPIYIANQPPLYFYFIAFLINLFGNGEIVMHFFQSIFTFFSLLIFYEITRLLNLKKGLLLTVLFAFCPAFLVNQNLMVDIPLLCFTLCFFYYLLKQDVHSETARYWKASLILSLSLLIKYTNIPLLVVLLITILWRKQYRFLYVVLIPIFVLGLWSLWNYAEFSGVHIINRPRNPITLALFTKNLLDVITCLGAIAPFSLAFFVGYFSRSRITTYFIPLIVLLFVVLTVATARNQLFTETANDILSTIFLINGLLVIILVIVSIWRNNFLEKKEMAISDVILVIWIASVGGFVILFAPFIANRHILLIVPPILFLGGRLLDDISITNAWQVVLVAITIGLILAVSDWQFADFYRRKAKEIVGVLPRQSRIWTVGHWGWQWYAHQNGLKEVQGDSMQFRMGDYLVRPLNISSQKIPEGVKLQPINYLTSPTSWSTFISTSYYACFYGQGAAWAYSKFTIDTIKIYRVTAVPIKRYQLVE